MDGFYTVRWMRSRKAARRRRRARRRVALLANVWFNHKPLGVERLPESYVEENFATSRSTTMRKR